MNGLEQHQRFPWKMAICQLFAVAIVVALNSTNLYDIGNVYAAKPKHVYSSLDKNEFSYHAQITIRTTSDFTNLRLIQGEWHALRIISVSEQAQAASIENGMISLTQSIDRAESGNAIEMTVECDITGPDRSGVLIFEIDRGHIGSTDVEIEVFQDDVSIFETTLVWDAITPVGQNKKNFEVNLGIAKETAPNEFIVIGQLNFWYYGPGEYGGFENWDGSRSTPLTPLLGETYWASDPAVVYQQIEWAVEYGVDAFSIEWTTPRGIGCCGSMEDTLDDVFLKSPNIQKIRWAIFYDFILRLDQTKELGIDMSKPINFNQKEVYDTFVADFEHFAKKYFDHPQYLTIDGRPVIYIWSTLGYGGDLAGAVQEARARVAELGFDVYIVGDEVCFNCFSADHASLFDANSTFTFLIPGIDSYSLDDVGEAAKEVDKVFQWWRDKISGLKVRGRDEFVNFQPAWAPQYDERSIKGFHPSYTPRYVPAMSKEQVLEMALVARKHAEPAGSEGMKLIWLNTWNNWAETTTVEPTAILGPKYPAGNYNFDMLEVVRDVFGVETFWSPLR